jgi:hypothetical protein
MIDLGDVVLLNRHRHRVYGIVFSTEVKDGWLYVGAEWINQPAPVGLVRHDRLEKINIEREESILAEIKRRKK